ncbi:ABC transporter permease subunit [Bacillus salitolerans]|uniref:ABC transporter permease subunit n=1 Tax=Bacillus salitolerans TaxID=1437434 RepID=A0ABW4LQ48_9BACI
MKKYKNSPRMIICLSIIFLFFLVSIMFTLFFHTLLEAQDPLKYNEENQLIASIPFPPSIVPPFGTDRYGYNIFYKIIDGAKYTILSVFIIALLRILISFILGVLCHFYVFKLEKGRKYFVSFFEGFYSLPQVLIAFILISPFLIDGFNRLSTIQIIIYQMAILIILALPNLTLLIADELNRISKEEFMYGAKILGGSELHMFKKHLFPHIKQTLIVLFSQQSGQVLILLIHLGLLDLFLGGSRRVKIEEGVYDKLTITNEWSGLIGTSFRELLLAPWIMIAPLIAFMIVIICVNVITNDLIEQKNINKTTSRVLKDDKEYLNVHDVDTANFSFVRNQKYDV